MGNKKFLDKMMGIIGLDEEVYEEEQLEQSLEESKNAGRQRKGNVVSLHTQRQMQVVLVEPDSYDEVQAVADNLKNRRPVVINLEKAEAELARRVVDFMSGVTYALDGSIQRVGKNIFLCVPNNIDISNELKEQSKEKNSILSIFHS